MIAIENGRIVYRERMPVLLRIFAGFIGVGCATMIPYPFLIHTRWGEPTWTNLLSAFAIVFSAGIGLFFVALALVSTQELTFDPYRRTLYRNLRGPLGRWRHAHPFSSVTRLEVIMRDSEDGPYPTLQLHLAGKRWPISFGELGDKAQTEAWHDRIDKMVRA